MLVFFIHGVATRNVQYADDLKKSLRDKFNKAQLPVPHFCASFWGNALSDIEKMWHGINQDTQAIHRKDPSLDVNDCFRYRQLREGMLSEFAGDMFVYLNSKRGVEIRRNLARQLIQFLNDHPDETELHLIAHSLGTVIFWDMFFSDRFSEDDPAHWIRRLIRGLSNDSDDSAPSRMVDLKSITTMGSPILFFNMMLGIDPQRVKDFAARKPEKTLPWLNIIHPADIIAYPLKASFAVDELDALQLRDVYLSSNALAKMINVDAALLFEGVDSHIGYWNSKRTTQLIFEHLVGDRLASLQFSLLRTQLISNVVYGDASKRKGSAKKSAASYDLAFLQQAIASLQQVSGMTDDSLKLSINDKPVKSLRFLDGSGTLSLIVNMAQVHHVYVFDPENVCLFSGFVGWIHTQNLTDAIAEIETTWC